MSQSGRREGWKEVESPLPGAELPKQNYFNKVLLANPTTRAKHSDKKVG